jgi:hypothetical protein
MSYVVSGEITASQLVDIWAKLSFSICFSLRELIEMLPHAVKLLHPLGRICDLLDAQPNIEPLASTLNQASQVVVEKANPAELGQLLRDECRLVFEEGDAGDSSDGVIKRKSDSAELVSIESAVEHDFVNCSRNSTVNGATASMVDAVMTKAGGLAFPVKVIFSTKVRPPKFRGEIEFRDGMLGVDAYFVPSACLY